MTKEEARALKPGDAVEFCIRPGEKALATGIVEHVPIDGNKICLRRPGTDLQGRRHHKLRRYACHVFHVRCLPPITANVYADWLQERGEYRAAALLREAFPIDNGKEES